MKAATYTRYSSDNQREESIEAQQDAIQKYAKEKGYTIVREYSDKALSGRESEKRAEFLQMIEDAKQGFFDTVLIHKQNRFARNRGEAVYYKGKLKRYGVKVIAVAEDFGDGPVAVLIESILEGFAEYQSLDLANEVMKGLMVNAKHCKHTGGRPLFGYRVNSILEYEIEEDEAKIVRFAFEKAAAGWSYAEIVRHLNDSGYRKRNGKKWSRNIIFYMLRNERYAGVYTFNMYKKKLPNGKRVSNLKKNETEIVRIPGGMPAIVSEELFRKVKQIMEGRKSGPIRRGSRYLLSGFIFCGLCGSAYTGQGKKVANYAYYVCSRRKNVMDCNGASVNKIHLEEKVIAFLQELLSSLNIKEMTKLINDYLSTREGDLANEREKIQAEISSLNKKIDNLLDAIEEGIAVKGRLQQHIERKQQLEIQLKIKPKQNKITVEKIKANIEKLNPEGKSEQELREIFQTLKLKIYIYPDRRDITLNDIKVSDNVHAALPAPTLSEILVKLLV